MIYMFSKFDEDSQKVLLMAKKEMMDLKHPYFGSEHLLLAILHNTDLSITQVLSEYKITYKKYKHDRKQICKDKGERLR